MKHLSSSFPVLSIRFSFKGYEYHLYITKYVNAFYWLRVFSKKVNPETMNFNILRYVCI